MNDRVADFWAEFWDVTGIQGEYTAWAFGDTPEMATELGLLVRDGPKRATAGPIAQDAGAGEPSPAPGDLSVILDGRGEPLCVIRTTAVETRRFGDVTEEFAWTEGEGDRSLAHWRNAHIAYFESIGSPVDDDTEIMLKRFDLLWPRR